MRPALVYSAALSIPFAFMPDNHPLVVRFGAFGDMVMLTPLLELLHRRSGLPCDVVGIGAWNEPLFRHLPSVREVLTVGSRTRPYLLDASQRRLVRTLREREYRFVWICETNSKSYRLLARAGLDRENCVNQLDLDPVEEEHYCAKWLRLGNQSPTGFDKPPLAVEDFDTGLCVLEEEIDECRRWLDSRGVDPAAPLICIQPGSKRTTRRGRADRPSNTKYWHESNWAGTIDAIGAEQPSARFILCGVEAEKDMCRAIAGLCQTREAVYNAAGDLPMRRLLALLSLAHSCISVDTGPAHAAAALNCPLVVLFGKADPERFRPVSADSPVRVLLGHDDGNGDAGPDIGLITRAQVLSAWQDIAQAESIQT